MSSVASVTAERASSRLTPGETFDRSKGWEWSGLTAPKGADMYIGIGLGTLVLIIILVLLLT